MCLFKVHHCTIIEEQTVYRNIVFLCLFAEIGEVDRFFFYFENVPTGSKKGTEQVFEQLAQVDAVKCEFGLACIIITGALSNAGKNFTHIRSIFVGKLGS